MRTYLGYITISLLVPVLILFIFLSHQEWSLAQSPYHVLDERIPVESIELAQNSYMKAANGKVISEISTGEKRTYLKLEDIPLFLENLFIVTEDQKFYDHAGIDLSGISRALLINSQNKTIEQGGSTITQQLARNVYLSHDRTYNRKLSELIYAYQIERKKSKPEIMELYLNAIYFSNGAYGIEAASQYYFSKPTTIVTWGNMDMKVLRQNCQKAGLDFPFSGKENDLCLEYKRFFGDQNQTGLWKAVQAYGKEGTGKHHRALDDAITTYNIFKLVEKDKSYMKNHEPTTIGDRIDLSKVLNHLAL